MYCTHTHLGVVVAEPVSNSPLSPVSSFVWYFEVDYRCAGALNGNWDSA